MVTSRVVPSALTDSNDNEVDERMFCVFFGWSSRIQYDDGDNDTGRKGGKKNDTEPRL